MKTHFLKTWPEYFLRVWDGAKRAELRRDDRRFCINDNVVLMEWEPGTETYTGREVECTITDIIRDAPSWGLEDGFAILSLGKPVCRYAELASPAAPEEPRPWPTVGGTGDTPYSPGSRSFHSWTPKSGENP